jgi:hypothetical protein
MSEMMLEKPEDIDVTGLTDDHSYVFRRCGAAGVGPIGLLPLRGRVAHTISR